MGRVPGLLLALSLGGACDRDLLPGERILGDEVPARIVEGEAGSRTGAAVAVGLLEGALRVAVAAPGTERLLVLDEDGQQVDALDGALVPALAIGQERIWFLRPGEGLFSWDPGQDPVLQAADAGATALALCPDGEVRTLQDADAALACGPQGQDLRSRCDADGSCAVLLDGLELDRVSPGSDLGFFQGEACWGDARIQTDQAEGSLRCAGGLELTGAPGEHLGHSVGAGRVAGVFDKWIVPARARIHPIGGGEIWSIDRAAESSGLALAEQEGLLVVGVPGYLGTDPEQGRVYLVDLSAAEAP